MKYTIEVTNSEYAEVDVNSEEEAIQKVKNSIQDPRVRGYIILNVYKENLESFVGLVFN